MEPLISIFKSNTLIGIDVFDKKRVQYLEWQSYKKGWFSERKEGFICILPLSGDRVFIKEELEAGVYNGIPLIVEDKKAYFRPHITFTFTEGRKYHVYTKTLEDAISIAKKERKEHFPYPESISFNVNK